MKSVDYEKLGLRSGVEIHHQILTEKKMFCNCPAGRYSELYDAEVLRHMRPTLSEMGTYDGTALMEFKTRKDVIYRINKESVCTYELDDTPPFRVNQQGLDIAIEIALLLDCKLVDEMFITRKQYLDGSIPTGFQRTAIVGVDGSIPYKDRRIGIIQLGYEEDACREVSDTGHTIIFRTDRLSMPLIEVVTAAEMRTPQEVADVVRIIGRLLRATGKVRRGIGAVRQDVNVSINGSTRVEIKGVPRIGYIPALVHNEALRHKALLDIRDELKGRGVTEESLVSPRTADVTDIFRYGPCRVLREAVAGGKAIHGVMIPGFGGILNHPTQPGLTFASEFAGRVRVIACIDTKPNIFHTDDFPSECRREELKNLRKTLGAGKGDVAVISWGSEADVKTAMDEIRLRAIDATRGVPNETRQRLDGGLTDFERILPGADRMYPDTDSPTTKIAADRVARIRARLPARPWELEERYTAMGLPSHIVKALAVSRYAALFDRVAAKCRVDPMPVAVTLIDTLKALRRDGVDVCRIREENLEALFEAAAAGKVVKEAVPRLLRELAARPDAKVAACLEMPGLSPASAAETDEEIERALHEDSFHGDATSSKAVDFYIGRVKRKLGERVSGKEIANRIKEKIKTKA